VAPAGVVSRVSDATDLPIVWANQRFTADAHELLVARRSESAYLMPRNASQRNTGDYVRTIEPESALLSQAQLPIYCCWRAWSDKPVQHQMLLPE